MRHVVALSLIMGCSSAAFASDGVLFSNLPPAPTQPGNYQDGIFSDAMSSQGLNFYSQAFGQGFRIASDSTVKSLRVWGASEYVESTLPPEQQQLLSNNVTSLQVSIFRLGGQGTSYPVVASWTISIADVLQARNGAFVPNIMSPVFQIDMNLGGNVSLTAGDYMLSIGGVLADPDGSAFAWISGRSDGSRPGESGYVTTGDIASQWGIWSPDSSGATGAMELYGIPAPGALAVLALAGRSRGRRRD